MPAEIDTGRHRVLHCDSHVGCPTATTSIHVSTSANGLNKLQRSAPKDRQNTGNRSSSKHDESSLATVPRIGIERETILGGRDFLARSRVLTQPLRRRQGEGEEKEDGVGVSGACRESRISPGGIEDVIKDKTERAESRLRDETEGYRLAATSASGSSIAKRRSLRDRFQTRPQPASRGSETPDADAVDYLGGAQIARRISLFSSHRSCTRAKEEIPEDRGSFRDVDEGFYGENVGRNDTWTSKSRRVDFSRRYDKRTEDKWDEIARDPASGKWIRRGCRVYSSLQLAFLLLFIVFGRYGLLGSSSVLRANARPIANGLSVLGIGIIGAVNARSIDPIGDAGIRAERSANLSHMTGPYRGKIQMYIKNRHLQILPDGTVNGSNDDTSDYTIFQRKSVGANGQLIIQGMATCLFLCMDSCGGLYGSPNCTAGCVFNETLEQHNYNTYSSVYWSTTNRTLYLGLDRYGHPKKVQAKGHNLGRLSANARVLTQVAPSDRVENLQKRIMGSQHKVRHWCHHRQISDDVLANCPRIPPQEKDGRDKFRCRKRKKRKKRKRRCRPSEQPGPQCHVAEDSLTESVTEVVEASSEIVSASSIPESKRSCEGAASEEACRRQALSVPAKKRKSRIDGSVRNLTLGKNKAPTSNAKKSNVNVADNQSKKPDLTDGKKKRKRTTPQRTSRGTTAAPPSRKQYSRGTTSSSRVSSSLTALGSEEQRASIAASSSSPSLLGASTALFSITRPNSPQSNRKKSPLSSKNHIARPIGSHRVGKFFQGDAASSGRFKSMPETTTTSRSKVAFSPPTTKVSEEICAYTTTPLLQFALVPPSSSSSSQESDEDLSLVEDESSIVTVESSTFTASDEDIAEATTFRLDDSNYEDSDTIDTIPQTTTRFPIERLAM